MRSWTLNQALSDLGHVMTLEAREIELLLRREPRDVWRRNGTCAVRRAAFELADVGKVRRRVGQAHHDHPVMQQGPVEGGDGGLVAAAGRGRSEYAADLADQRAAYP